MTSWSLSPIELELLEDRSPEQEPGFLRLRRRVLRSRYADGTLSAPYTYDSVDRRATDAVVIALHSEGRVVIRSSLRPPVAFRTELAVPELGDLSPVLWELPAGLVEADESGEDGLRACAARETLEETGFVVAPERFRPLGRPVYLSPGVIAERLYYFAAEVDEAERGVPAEDGSPVEARAEIRLVPFQEALEGPIGDAKSEVGIARLMREMERAR